jgi:hypothetical protein
LRSRATRPGRFFRASGSSRAETDTASEKPDDAKHEDEEPERQRQAQKLRREADGWRAGEEAEIADGADGGDRGAGRQPFGPRGGRERDRERAGDAGADEREGDDRGRRMRDQEARSEPERGHSGAGARDPRAAEAGDEPVAGEAPPRHHEREGGKGECCRLRAGTEALAQIDGAPVADGTFREQGAKADQAEHEHRAVGPGEGLAGADVEACGQHQPARRKAECQDERADHDEVRQQGHLSDRDRAGERGAAHGAEAEHAVQRGHDRPAVPALDRDALRVHRDVQRAGGSTHHEEGGKQQGEPGRQRDQDLRGREGDERRGRGPAAAEAVGERARERHGAERAQRHAEQREAKRRLA